MSLPSTTVLDGLGVALGYPRVGYRTAVAEVERELAAAGSEAAPCLRDFRLAIDELGQVALEDLYTSSFDLNPVATLEVGWHLFGEQYRRGRFLVRSRELLTAVGLDEGGELPDHLMSLLPAVARIETREAALLAALYLLPAVEKMTAGLADKENPYEHLLTAVGRVLEPLALEAGELPAPAIPADLVQIGIDPERQRPSAEKGTIS